MIDQLRIDAIDRAYRDHAEDVYRVAYAILRDPDTAMDATQDAFAQAFRRWEQYDANRPLRPLRRWPPWTRQRSSRAPGRPGP